MEDGHDQDDVPQLSGAALSALQDFYRDRDAQEKNFEDLKSAIKESEQNTKLSMETFTEDWNTSQFWYSDETAIILAEQLLSNATKETSIAIVSAPSVFIQIKNLLSSGTYIETPHIALLEFDERFAVLAEFVHYDFHFPLKLPSEMKGKYDRIICDPPFLSTDCQTKAAITVRWLSRPASAQGGIPRSRIIICTGERMEGLIGKIYPGVRTTTFEPQHAHGRLSNEFRCYSSFACSAWSWR